jgi:vancomycin resistance protein YoaR
LAVVAAPLVVIALLSASWGVDAAVHRDRVARNVEVAGRPVGGMTRAELTETVDQLAAELPANPVTIDTGEFAMETTAGDLGLAIDTDATVESVWEIGRDDPLPTRPVRWIESVLRPREAAVRLDVDAATLTSSLATLEGDRRTRPVEPGLTGDPAGVTLVAGTDGRELSTNAVVRALPMNLDEIGRPITVRVERTVIEPAVPDQAVQALVDQANQVTEGEVTLSAGAQTFTIPGPEFRPAFTVAVDGSPEAPTPRLAMEPEAVAGLLDARTPAGAGNPTGVRFEIRGGTPVPIAGSDVQVCCGDGAPDAIVQGLLAGTTSIDVPTRTLTAAEGVQWAESLGIRQVVGEFTTNHPAGQPRVQNIHRIADTLRGVVIAPGDTFSVNQFVGERTAAKGYVSAPIIENGEFTEGVGGGVSQFATTLFNAAFFAGLDIPAYMAHTKYISRYPFGREATLAYPSVDLKIRNNTPHGVMIWPTYTGSSISVQLWSTPYVRGEQTGQNKSSGCGRIVTTRTRTWTDGRTATDTFNANYDCE